MSKKKDQEKFNAYAINTNDAWEIDDRTMTLRIIDKNDDGVDDDDDLAVPKQVRATASNASDRTTHGKQIESSTGNVTIP